MKPPAWRAFVLALVAAGMVFAIVDVLDVVGAGSNVPWIGQGEPWLGRWGAFLGGAYEPDSIKVLSIDQGGPSYRADLKPDDLIRVRRSDPRLRFWIFYRPVNNQVVDLDVFRPSTKHQEPTRLVTGPARSYFTTLPSDLGSVILLLLAAYHARKKRNIIRHLLFATALALLAIGVLANPSAFGAPSSWVYIVFVIFNLALPASVYFWIRYAADFGEPLSRLRKRMNYLGFVLVGVAIAFDLAPMVYVLNPGILDPVIRSPRLLLGWLPIAPMTSAVIVGLFSSALAVAAARGFERKEAFKSLLPLAITYCSIETYDMVAHILFSYAVGYKWLIVKNAVIFFAALLLTCVSMPDLVSSVWRRTSVVARWILGSPRSLLPILAAVGALAAILWFGILVLKDLRSHVIIISDIGVPGDFADRGFTSSTESLRLRDELNNYVRRAETSLRPDALGVSSREAAIVIPALNLPVDSFENATATVLGLPPRTRITGEFTERENELWVRLRLNDQIAFEAYEAAPPGKSSYRQTDDLLAAAPRCLLQSVRPYFVAAHWYTSQNPAAAADAARHIIDTSGLPADSSDIVYTNLLLASIDGSRNDLSAAANDIDAAAKHDSSSITHAWRGMFYLSDAQEETQGLKDVVTQIKARDLSRDSLLAKCIKEVNVVKPQDKYGQRYPDYCKRDHLDRVALFALDEAVRAYTGKRQPSLVDGIHEDRNGDNAASKKKPDVFSQAISRLEFQASRGCTKDSDRDKSLAIAYYNGATQPACRISHDLYWAVKEINEAVNLDGTFVWGHDYLGQYYQTLGDLERDTGNYAMSRRMFAQAAIQLQIATQAEPDESGLWKDLADYYIDRIDYFDAYRSYESAVKYDPDAVLVRRLKALVTDLNGKRNTWIPGVSTWAKNEVNRETSQQTTRVKISNCTVVT
jgi:tetratricopeptide (TPR) repeat protein